jgi:hypothetical protein
MIVVLVRTVLTSEKSFISMKIIIRCDLLVGFVNDFNADMRELGCAGGASKKFDLRELLWIRAPIWCFVQPCAALATSSIARRPIQVDLSAVRCWNKSSMADGGLGECERRSLSSADEWDTPKAHRLEGLRSSQFHSPCPALLLLLFPLHHPLLVLLFDPLQFARNDGTNTPRIVIVDLSRHTAEYFFAFFLAVPSVLATTQGLRGRRFLDRPPGGPISHLIAPCSAITPSSAHPLPTGPVKEDWVPWSWVWSSVRAGAGDDVDCWADSAGSWMVGVRAGGNADG